MDEDLEGNDKIRPQYAHERMYGGMTRKMPLFRFRKRKRTAVRVAAKHWRVSGAWTYIVTDD